MSSFELNWEFQEFQKTGELYKQAFNCSVLPTIIHDIYFNIIDVNDKALSEFGYSKEEFLKLKIFDLHDVSELTNSLEVLEQMQKKDSLKVKTLFKRKDNSLFSAEAVPCKINFKRLTFIQVHLEKIESQI